ncbi:uncharacterized protein ACBR49_016749 [Aulostomus maculatus]
MIATGGLLRINARRQDSVHSKPHKAPTHKRKPRRQRRSEVVVVKGKLKLCSVSGLVAALGLLVLLVGVVMAALGYWPRGGLFFTGQPQEGATLASFSSPNDADSPVQGGGGDRGNKGDKDTDGEAAGVKGGEKGGSEQAKEEEAVRDGDDKGVNGTASISRETQGFLDDFLDRYLHSDKLKVFGPLIMGIGIFLFICANAVLHENRDKKTKIINLRDIYSTVIDLHSLRKPGLSACHSSANPLNGLVNYVQSQSLETKPRALPASLRSMKEEGGGSLLLSQPLPGSSSDVGDAVFGICQENRDMPPPSSTHRLSLPTIISPIPRNICWALLQKEALSSFTLPLSRPRPAPLQRRHSGAESSRSWTGITEGEEGRVQDEVTFSTGYPPLVKTQLTPGSASCNLSSIHREMLGGHQALLLLSSSSLTPSHLSHSSHSHLLSSSTSTPVGTCRRWSLPVGSMTSGYSKLSHGEVESFEWTETIASHHVTSHRKYLNKEKLWMISQEDHGQRPNEKSETTTTSCD